jgi:hypothetical protein
VADPKQICRMLGYVLLWLWTETTLASSSDDVDD